jgi:hypothetical protein
VQVAAVAEVPAVAVQLTGEPRACVPFMNWTVPVMPAPFLAELVTVALSMTVPPEAIEVEPEVSAVVVATVPVLLTVTVPEPLLDE